MSVSAESYGSDPSGLISGFSFADDGVGRAVDSEQAAACMRAIDDGEKPAAFGWFHFNAANAGTARWMEEHFELSDEYFGALSESGPSTRIEYASETLVAVLNDVIYDFPFSESSQVTTVWISIDPKTLVTARNLPSRSIDRLRTAVKSGEAFASPLSLFIHLLHDQGDVLLGIVRTTVKKVDAIEDRLLAGRLGTKRASLGTLRRDLVRLQRLLAPEPAALFRLLNRPPQWVAEEDASQLRQSAEEYSLILRDMTTLQERIKLLQEEIAASINERTGRTLFVLTAVTVLALPINVIAGLFGMNVGGVPYGQDPEGFWIVVAIVATFSLFAAWLVFRERDE